VKNKPAFDTSWLLDIDFDKGKSHYGGVRRVLQGMIHMMKPEVVVEIGVHKAHTTICLALASKPYGTKIYAIDPNDYGQGERAKRHLGGEHNIVFIMKRAQEVDKSEIKTPSDLLFIDGDHGYGPTKEIYEKWSRWMRPGGRIVIHDIILTRTMKTGVTYGVWRVWDEITWPKFVLEEGRPGIGFVRVPGK